MFLKTREGAEVQPEAEDISEELPSTPAITKAIPSLWAGHAVLTSIAPGFTLSLRYYSRGKFEKATWNFVGFLSPDRVRCDDHHFSKDSTRYRRAQRLSVTMSYPSWGIFSRVVR